MIKTSSIYFQSAGSLSFAGFLGIGIVMVAPGTLWAAIFCYLYLGRKIGFKGNRWKQLRFALLAGVATAILSMILEFLVPFTFWQNVFREYLGRGKILICLNSLIAAGLVGIFLTTRMKSKADAE